MILPFLLLMQTSILFTTGSGLKVFFDPVRFVTVKSGDNVSLNCVVGTGGPADNISWYNTADLNTTIKISNRSARFYSLVLYNVTLKDAATYRCQANKGRETDYDEYTLDVYAEPLVQLSPLKRVSDNVRQDCTAKGFPKPNITWYFNDEVIEGGDGRFLGRVFIMELISPTSTSLVSSLALIDADGSLEGTYTCKAMNEMGSSKQILQLLMKSKPEVIPGDTQIIRESGNVTLACEGQKLLYNDPDVVFFWNFQGKRIPTDRAHYKQSIIHVPGKYVVHMKLACDATTATDAGLYECHVKSSLKQSSGKVRLIVVSKDIKPKARIAGLNEKAVKLGSNITLRCEISYPAYLKTVNMSWANSTAKYNVTEKNADDLTSRSFVLSLDFVNITRQDLGSYTCQINTSIGSSVARVMLLLVAAGGKAPLSPDTFDKRLVMLALILTTGIAVGVSGATWVWWLWRKKNQTHLDTKNKPREELKCDLLITKVEVSTN